MHSLKFLLDADMPRSSAEVIRSTGYDVEDVRDIGMGAAKDREILRYPEHPGGIVFRLPYTFRAEELNRVLKEFLGTVGENEIKNAIIIVELGRYRRRPL